MSYGISAFGKGIPGSTGNAASTVFNRCGAVLRVSFLGLLLGLSGFGGLSNAAGISPPVSVARDYVHPLTTGVPLSAYFGASNVQAQNALQIGLAACGINPPAGALYDGVPVVFPKQINPNTLYSMVGSTAVPNFSYYSTSGTRPVCATLLPATSCYSSGTVCAAVPGYVQYEPAPNQALSFENYTVLLIFPGMTVSTGTGPGSIYVGPPSGATTVVNVTSEDTTTTYNGSSVSIIPLGTGPQVALATPMPFGSIPIGAGASGNVGTYCPSGTTSAVLLVWQGGVRNVLGNELVNANLNAYSVTVMHAGTPTLKGVPDGMGDASNDYDNNQILCQINSDTIISGTVNANTDYDPTHHAYPSLVSFTVTP